MIARTSFSFSTSRIQSVVGRTLGLLSAVLCLTGSTGCQTGGGRKSASAVAPDQLQQSLVEISVTRVETDRFLPWRKSQPITQRGYGVAVGTNLLLTVEELVRNNTLIQIRRAGSGAYVPARVVLADPRSSLALVAPVYPSQMPPFLPLGLVSNIQREASHTLVQFGAGDQIQAASGAITAIGLDQVARGSAPQLTYDIVSDLRAAQAGTPVLINGRLAGLIVRLKPNSNACLAIAPEVLARFLTAARQTPFVGVPEGGFEFAALVDPVRRRFLGVADNDKGVLVVSLRSGGSAESGMQVDDVLVAWDGFSVDNMGFYLHPMYGRLPLSHLITSRRSVGEPVEVDVVRKGKPQRLTLTLQAYDELASRVPENGRGAPDDYVVEGGLIFRELTLDYLQQHGEVWLLRAEPRLVWEALTQAYQKTEPDRRLVILVGVLPDPINIGYQTLQNQIVTSVNGQPIENLSQLAQIIASGGLTRLGMEGWTEAPLFFDAAMMPAANARIQAGYRIPSLTRITKSPGASVPIAP